MQHIDALGLSSGWLWVAWRSVLWCLDWIKLCQSLTVHPPASSLARHQSSAQSQSRCHFLLDLSFETLLHSRLLEVHRPRKNCEPDSMASKHYQFCLWDDGLAHSKSSLDAAVTSSLPFLDSGHDRRLLHGLCCKSSQRYYAQFLGLWSARKHWMVCRLASSELPHQCLTRELSWR